MSQYPDANNASNVTNATPFLDPELLPTITDTLFAMVGNQLPPPPPSSVHGEVDEDDDQLPVDDSFHDRAVAVNYIESNDNDAMRNVDLFDSEMNSLGIGQFDEESLLAIENNQLQPPTVPTPQQPELTMKEKLVLRERQQRIESERARLKRHFALSSTNDESDNVDEGHSTANRNCSSNNAVNHQSNDMIQDNGNDFNVNGQEFEEESTRAHPDEDDATADEANRRLGFNMERFLRNSDTFIPEVETSSEGVVMERFLNDILENPNFERDTFAHNDIVDINNDGTPSVPTTEPHRSVSFDVNATNSAVHVPDSVVIQALEFQHDAIMSIPHPSFGEDSAAGVSLVSNASLRTEVNTVRDDLLVDDEGQRYSNSSVEHLNDTDQVSHDDASSHISDDEPRVLRLTEADMLEMAAIEEASIGNAPPSDRDDVESYSEIGELTDFGGSGGGIHRFLSDPTFNGPDTPTTALESASQISPRSGNRGGTSAVSSSSATNMDVDIITGHVEGIPPETSDIPNDFIASASASVAANPPSEGGRDDDDDTVDIGSQLNDTDHRRPSGQAGVNDVNITLAYNDVASGLHDSPASLGNNIGFSIVEPVDANHMENSTAINRQRHYDLKADSVDESKAETVDHCGLVDGFDFDKDEPRSPFGNPHLRANLLNEDSFQNLPHDPWSPQGHMQISPLQVTAIGGPQPFVITDSIGNLSQNINITMPHDTQSILETTQPKLLDQSRIVKVSETTPLLGQFGNKQDKKSLPTVSMSKTGYRSSKLLQDLSTRLVPLFMTLILEIPVLFLIFGGSDEICRLVGRSRYHLLLSFLPLTCAISGNVGQQTCTDTSERGMSDGYFTPAFKRWFFHEFATSILLGTGVGIVVGLMAYLASDLDVVFGLVLLIVQVFSVVTASIVGTVVPILCSSVVNLDSGKLSGFLITAIQDIVGSFSIVIFSYYMFLFFAPRDVSPADRCIPQL